MEFSDNKPIWLQIVDWCYGRIIAGVWQPGGRVPSVRELAVELAVNTHTALKAYDELQNAGIIYMKRGLGNFLADDARSRVADAQRREFFDVTLVGLASQMRLLGITPAEVDARLSALCEAQS